MWTGPCAGRRALLLSLSALAGCDTLEGFLTADKPGLPGERRPVIETRRGLEVDAPTRPLLPPPVADEDWRQAGGTPAHAPGHPALADSPRRAWSADIGVGGGYRRKITAQPVVAGRMIFTMDSDAVVAAFDTAGGGRAWQVDTQGEKDRSTNVGGGIAVDGATLFVATGRGDVLALDAASGKTRWRVGIAVAARGAPTVVNGRLFVPVIGGQLLALSAADGSRLWSYQSAAADTTVLGLPSPAVEDGLVVAGFGSGELVALRDSSGAVAWSDSLAATRGRTSLVDLSAIRGLPVIRQGRVFATGLGGLTVCLDLRSGRRLWEREIGSGETPWVAGDWVFVLSTDNRLAAISRADGSIAWVTQIPRFANPEKARDPILWTGPVLAGDRLVLAGSAGQALAVSPYTGKILGGEEIGAAISVPPVVAGGTLYLVTDDANLLALR